MIDPNEHEEAALRHAGAAGGEYVESLGRTDLAQGEKVSLDVRDGQRGRQAVGMK